MEEILALILLVFGTFLGGLIMWKIFDMVKSSIKGKNNVEVTAEDFDRLARAFMQHSKEMRERVQKLEAIVADESDKERYPEIEAPKNDDSLTNDLQQKNKVRS